MEHSSYWLPPALKFDKTTLDRVELIDKRLLFGLVSTTNGQRRRRGSFCTKNQLNTTNRREDTRDIVVKIKCKGTTLNILYWYDVIDGISGWQSTV